MFGFASTDIDFGMYVFKARLCPFMQGHARAALRQTVPDDFSLYPVSSSIRLHEVIGTKTR
jgi:hypothetical protein